MLSAAELRCRVSPFVGLRPLRIEDPLFGRDLLRQELLDQLLADKVCVLYGQTGAGKSSLIAAGLVPDLRKHRFHVGLDHRDRGPIAAEGWSILRPTDLAAAGWGQAGESVPAPGSGSDGARRPSRVVIIDQFEDVFHRAEFRGDFQQRFVEWVAKLALDESVWVLIGIREDHLARLLRYRKLFHGELRSQIAVDPLSERQATEVVEKCLAIAGMSVPPEVVENLVARSILPKSLARGVVPVFLQSVCERWWARLLAETSDENPPDVEGINRALTAVRGEENMVADHVSSVIEGLKLLPADEIRLREWLETALIQDFERRRADPASARVPQGVLDELSERYLIEPVAQFPDLVELSVDVLVDGVLKSNESWFAGKERDAYAGRRRRWRRDRDNSLLLRYSEIRSYRREGLADDDFFRASREKLSRERHLILATGGLALAVFALALAAMYFVFQKSVNYAEEKLQNVEGDLVDATSALTAAQRLRKFYADRADNLSQGVEAVVATGTESAKAVALGLIALHREVRQADALPKDTGDTGNRASFLRSALTHALSKPMTDLQISPLGAGRGTWRLVSRVGGIDCQSDKRVGRVPNELPRASVCAGSGSARVKTANGTIIEGRLVKNDEDQLGFYADVNGTKVRLRAKDAALLHYRPGLAISDSVPLSSEVQFVKLFRAESQQSTAGLSVHKGGLVVLWSLPDYIADECADLGAPCELRLEWLGMLVGGEVQDALVDNDLKSFAVVSEYGELARAIVRSSLELSHGNRNSAATSVLNFGAKKLLFSTTDWCIGGAKCSWIKYLNDESDIGFVTVMDRDSDVLVIGRYGSLYRILPNERVVSRHVPVATCKSRAPLQGIAANLRRELAVGRDGMVVLFHKAEPGWALERWTYSLEGCVKGRAGLKRETLIAPEALADLGVSNPTALDVIEGAVVFAADSSDGGILVACGTSPGNDLAGSGISGCARIDELKEPGFSASAVRLSDSDFAIAIGGVRGAVLVWRLSNSRRPLWKTPLQLRRHVGGARVLWSDSSSSVRLGSTGREGEVVVHDIEFVEFQDQNVGKQPNPGSIVVHRFVMSGTSLSRTSTGMIAGSLDAKFIDLPMSDDALMRSACDVLEDITVADYRDEVEEICNEIG